MRIRFLLWAQMRVDAGSAAIDLVVPDGETLSGALDLLYASRPELRRHRDTTRAAVGNEYASTDHALTDGDEVSLIPPVQGG